jgi:membrane-associated phospholipid phosphatase
MKNADKIINTKNIAANDGAPIQSTFQLNPILLGIIGTTASIIALVLGLYIWWAPTKLLSLGEAMTAMTGVTFIIFIMIVIISSFPINTQDGITQIRFTFTSYRRIILSLTLMTLLITILYMGSRGVFPGLDIIALIIINIFLWLVSDRYPLLDFAPLFLLVIMNEIIGIVISQLGTSSIHLMDTIYLEKTLTGGIIPSHVLQQTLGAQPFTLVVDAVANGFYLTHFLSATVLALLLWQFRRSNYWPFLLGLTILTYAALLTYIFFPSAPPWWASSSGLLTQSVNLGHSLLSPQYIMAIRSPMLSMPSLHTAYSCYIAGFCIYTWGRKGILTLILPVGMAFSCIYLGFNYLVDILAGMTYALVALTSIIWWSRQRPNILPQIANPMDNISPDIDQK